MTMDKAILYVEQDDADSSRTPDRIFRFCGGSFCFPLKLGVLRIPFYPVLCLCRDFWLCLECWCCGVFPSFLMLYFLHPKAGYGLRQSIIWFTSNIQWLYIVIWTNKINNLMHIYIYIRSCSRWTVPNCAR